MSDHKGLTQSWATQKKIPEVEGFIQTKAKISDDQNPSVLTEHMMHMSTTGEVENIHPATFPELEMKSMLHTPKN
jgi:hypothetical protein